MDERRLAPAFVELADNLVDDFDLIEFLALLTDRCVTTLEVAAAGLLLADSRETLRVMAASSEDVRLMELLQVQNDQGPGLSCFRTGQPVVVADLAAESDRWPRFASAALDRGFTAVQALPMRLRTQTIGALTLFHTRDRPRDLKATEMAQALADVATISILQQRITDDQDLLTRQLESALGTRVVIEQAKGKLAERYNLGMDEAFTLLRNHARAHNRRLTELCRAFISGTEPLFARRPDPASAGSAGQPQDAATRRGDHATGS
ncbi:response regulator receiver and ANTAR domain-containing protein [Streptomyces alboflavus]|uniref:Response regulator receiver and ANTAR domain-containing protein n=1 Tax=Streptomyces alboflavus TaxID=67267 RepID=A0A1Z1WFV7_9ACTN|nr:GAF and ANTAR domain-containing protein [Streptomyces alboflavus]ARX85269.1 response regulator receiver and ANTAR domain-containing protein [Streptomyces alboflavus]